MIKVPKRDFLFMDEAGDPGYATDYYIQGLLHITDEALKKINVHLGAFRYFGNVRNELKSTKLNQLQREMLMNILKLSTRDDNFIKATAVYVDKKDYTGPYLPDRDRKGGAWTEMGEPTKFRHLMMRKLLEFHFESNQAQTKYIELIIDRFHDTEEQEQRMRNYLRTDKYSRLPNFFHIIQADSRYVELLQITDWITGSVKEHIFTHSERSENLSGLINVKQILK